MIIGIESSCDESAVAVFDISRGVVLDLVASQVDLHAEYGGVVPDIASREHVKNFMPLFYELKKFLRERPEYIAVTTHPGLPGCLNVGIAAARALGLFFGIPVLSVNHMYGHLFSPFIHVYEYCPGDFIENIKTYLPFLGLLVSGGNTILFKVHENMEISVIAETLDDAAGEAFDKGAKLLGLPYPGGMLIEKFAKNGNADKYHFPRAFYDQPDMKFSFSGLKTSLRYFLEKESVDLSSDMYDICASYQYAIVDALCKKLKQALSNDREARCLCLCGGVSNNDALRSAASDVASDFKIKFLAPLKKHTGDNAAMIAFAGFIEKFVGPKLAASC